MIWLVLGAGAVGLVLNNLLSKDETDGGKLRTAVNVGIAGAVVGYAVGAGGGALQTGRTRKELGRELEQTKGQLAKANRMLDFSMQRRAETSIAWDRAEQRNRDRLASLKGSVIG